MKATIHYMNRSGDTSTIIEGYQDILVEVEKILSTPGNFLAVENQIISSVDEAMRKISAVQEAELIVGRQVAGG